MCLPWSVCTLIIWTGQAFPAPEKFPAWRLWLPSSHEARGTVQQQMFPEVQRKATVKLVQEE